MKVPKPPGQHLPRSVPSFNKKELELLLVEQMAWIGLEVCDRAYVLESGVIVTSGTKAEVTSNARVVEAYLGKEDVT